MMQTNNENSFLRAFRLHRSGIRFLGAGLYCDAIHTLIHGLEVVKFSVEEDSYETVSVKFARWKQGKSLGRIQQQSKMEVDKRPMDHTCYTNEEWMTSMLKPCCNRCRGSLVGAMLYNMALAYHLHAINFEKGNQLYAYLNQASSLYTAAEGILQKYNVSIPPSLETNERHIHWVICSRPVPDSALLMDLQSPNMEAANFGSITRHQHQQNHEQQQQQQQQQPKETMCCFLTESNGVEANFGS
eukprot:CAMPEP_0113622348 /NCGR_PEP_ID=MMETSP0017_2-20120614/11448_1 /TAXON_ID=2856 /ORGANISM="Cylindrotheca closterium" /LENGTH=242 /DNA_ID=CAMNT_0000532169 /DNA_START=46 /DNA_END=774 /DNA_ORIENTATION=+ /assembly_acc=CAM_ASM_000147